MPDEEYWGDPKVYELGEQLDTIRQKLIDDVKQEVRDKINNLQTENRELKVRLKELDQLEATAKSEIRQAKYIKDNALRDAKRTRLEDIFLEVATPKYFAYRKSEKQPKCDNCDDNRRKIFTSPDGQTTEGYCECNDYIYSYKVSDEATFHYVYARNGEDHIVFYLTRDGELRESSSTIYTDEAFESIEDRRYQSILFNDKGKAQEFVEFINAKAVA